MKLLPLILASCAAVGCGSSDGGGPDAGEPPVCEPSAGPVAEVVATSSGQLRGAHEGDSWVFRGVPFAAAPVGDLRYRPPAQPACATEIRDATAFGPRCAQLDDGAFVGDEDCLQLNVWAPAAPSATPRPVMVWIHGGANSVGTAIDPIYDGRQLAETGDVVVVSTNYRLAQLGFLGHAGFAAEGNDGQGTFGLLDQIAALAWVQANIAAFGGDPDLVTIFGESAGARDVCALLAAPAAAGLFHRAVMESGACKFLPTRATAEQTAADVASAVGCQDAADVPACLRALPAVALLNALPGTPSALDASQYNPMVGGAVLPEQPETAIRAGRHHAVPFLIGANADETGSSVPAITTEAQYQAQVRARYPGALGTAVLAHYPATAFPTPRAALVRVTTDSRFVCPSREIARAVDAAQAEGTYRYFFSYRASPFGAVHGLEIPFLFGTFAAITTSTGQPYQPSAEDLALSAVIQRAWTTFARTGAPQSTPAWPAYGAGDPTLQLDATVAPVTELRDADCDFWEPFYAALE